MSGRTALLTFSIGPVQAFIAQARRVADQWAGSALLTHLVHAAIQELPSHGASLVFPELSSDQDADGLPNRFVCRVPLERVEEVAGALDSAVRRAWQGLVAGAVKRMDEVGLKPTEAIRQQAETAFGTAWSWVAENADGAGEEGYARDAVAGGRQMAASRMLRPFAPIEELGEKCAICGERSALPDGVRANVRRAWLEAEERATGTDLAAYFRFDQGRLCLVCATKRLFPKITAETTGRPVVARFRSLVEFEPGDEAPYLALVAMDGDHMGRILGWDAERIRGGKVESFHRTLSRVLAGFANSLRSTRDASVRLDSLEPRPRLVGRQRPQLIYAGGDDVVLVCSPQDALPLARAIREHYRRCCSKLVEHLVDPSDVGKLTTSAGILLAHGKQPAGLLFRQVHRLLDEGAKRRAGRDAVAIRLAKRSGAPVEVAFRWDDDAGLLDGLEELVENLAGHRLASRQTFSLALEERVLAGMLTREDQWERWLTDRLSRGEAGPEAAAKMARLMARFFVAGKVPALRIARYLGTEVER